jgi:tetratricopeptide (TPR) repeat protein
MTEPAAPDSAARPAGPSTSPAEIQRLQDTARDAQSRRDFERAEIVARLAVLLGPESAAARIVLADVLENTGRAQQAAVELLRALELDADQQAARLKLALLQARTGANLGETPAPLSPTVCFQLGRELASRGRRLDAAQHFRSALAQDPGLAAAAIELAQLLQQWGDLNGAIAFYKQALEVEPRSAQALCNMALALQGQMRHAEAMDAFDEAAAIAPDAAVVHLNRAMLLLLLGRWDDGWAEYEWRWRLPRRLRSQALRRWDGDPLKGRNLVLFSELGMGDTIQMLRYLPLVVARAAADGQGRILLACQAPLRRLLSKIPGVEPLGETQNLSPRDVEMPLSSLPLLFKTRPETVPAQAQADTLVIPEISAAADRVRSTPLPRIGLVWAGNPGHLNDATRSLPLAFLRPLIDGTTATIVSLQKGAAERELQQFATTRPVIALGPLLSDMTDTAAAIHELDLVISVDTAVAHLAATLQRRTWLMLPFASEWRWLLETETTPWYPTMRIFRQRQPGDWADVVERMRQEVARLFPR